MIRKIIKFPAASLRQKCQEVAFPLSEEVLDHIQDLKDTLTTTPNGVALASNQVLAEGWRVFVVRPETRVPVVPTTITSESQRDGTQAIAEVAINPVWEVYPPHEIDGNPHDFLEHAGFVEGCLSVPELSMPCVRQYWVELEYSDETGRRFIELHRGLGARIVQHECDHLDGKLLWDYAPGPLQVRTRMEAIKNRKRGK